MNKSILAGIRHSDKFCIHMKYTDSKGVETKRIVCAEKMVSKTTFRAFCLGRMEHRNFVVENCEVLELIPVENVLAPEEIG